MNNPDAALEAYLQHLGRQELELEHKIAELRSKAKEAVQAGQLSRADALCGTMDELKSALSPLQEEIFSIERRLYGARLRQRPYPK